MQVCWTLTRVGAPQILLFNEVTKYWQLARAFGKHSVSFLFLVELYPLGLEKGKYLQELPTRDAIKLNDFLCLRSRLLSS